MDKTRCACVLVMILFFACALPAGALAQVVPSSPEDGSALSDPPVFSWSPGPFNVFLFYTIFPYTGFSYFPVSFWLASSSLPMPSAWWDLLDTDVPCYWLVVGYDTVSHDYALSDVAVFTKVQGPACVDADGDGYGNPGSASCPHPEPDCDDQNAAVHPGIEEEAYGGPLCSDGLDNDCDGQVDGNDTGCVDILVTGPEEVVFAWPEDTCQYEDIPDVPARAFRDSQGRVQLISSHYMSYRMIGPDLDHLSRDCSMIFTSDLDCDPSRYDNHEWIHSVYTPDGTTVYALVHDEYHGNECPGQCPSGNYMNCWYNAVTLAVSTNSGDSYSHAAEPPANLVASLPYVYVPDEGPYGVFNPSNIILNPDDGYYYVLLHMEPYRDQAVGTCVARTDRLDDPTSWRAWDGSGFNVRFVDPYQESPADPSQHVCQPVSTDEIFKMADSVTYNTYLGKYLLVAVECGTDAQGNQACGFFFSLSDDLIHWSKRKLFLKGSTMWNWQPGDPDPMHYASVIDPDSPSRNFDVSDQDAYLYFTRFNNYMVGDPLDRDLIRVPIEIVR